MRISDWSSDVCSSDLGLDDLADRFAGKRIITVTSHRRENFGGGMENIAAAVSDVAARPDVAGIFPVPPNPNVRRVMDAALEAPAHVSTIAPLYSPHLVRLRDLCTTPLTASVGVPDSSTPRGNRAQGRRATT